jgi:hypothetical protein
MDMIVCANCINTIVTAEISTPDGKMVRFHVDGKVEHDVELWAIDQDQVMDGGIRWRDQADEAGTIGAVWSVSSNTMMDNVLV